MRKNPLHNSESKAGILITVIFHLTVIIVLLLYQIDATVRREESFVIDFSRQEEIERQEREMEELEKELSKMGIHAEILDVLWRIHTLQKFI